MTSPPPAKPSYSDRLKVNINKSERLRRKVLEINLESDDGSVIKIDNDTLAKLIAKLGIDTKTDVEGFQNSQKKMFVWLKESCNIDRYCKDVSIKVTDNIKTGLIKPMDRTEVTVTIKGLNYNTPDTLVIEYLSKHGKVCNSDVIYELEKDGMLKGLRNGNRKYLVDFSNGINMGSFHLFDGAYITVTYSGQRKTCGRCRMTAKDCLGDAFAKTCEQNNGLKVKLADHMKEHWKKIGFVPTNFRREALNEDEDLELTEDVRIKDNNKFTPTHRKPDNSDENAHFTSIIIRNLPKDIPDDEIKKFLVSKDLPKEHTELKIIRNKHNTNVEINSLDNVTCDTLIKNINEKKFFNIKTFCRGLSNLETPTKDSKKGDPTPEKPSVAKDVSTCSNNTANASSTDSTSSLVAQVPSDNVATPKKIPGLPPVNPKKSANKLKKAAAKEKNRLKKIEQKNDTKSKQHSKEDFLVNQHKKDTKQIKGYQFSDDNSNSDSSSNESDEDTSAGYFFRSPLTSTKEVFSDELFSPAPFSSRSAKQIQKEELWNLSLSSSRDGKRPPSPLDGTERRLKSRSESSN